MSFREILLCLDPHNLDAVQDTSEFRRSTELIGKGASL